MVDIKEEEGKSTTTLVFEVIIGLVSAAFAFVAALAWNEAIQAALARIFEDPNDLTGQFIYAVLVTILAVIVIVGLARALGKAKSKEKK
jgi:uncharacterized BrkB/YihY/UPF0761 family membrane protein